MVSRSKKDYLSAISNPELIDKFSSLLKFTNDDDRQLLKQIDKHIATELKDKEIKMLTIDDFDLKKFDL